MTGKPDAGLYIDPPTHHFLGDRLFDSATVPFGGDDILAPYRCIREAFAARGIPVHTADKIHKAPASQRKLYVSMGRIPPFEALAGRSDVVLSAFFAMECPIVEPSLYRALPRVGRHVKRIFSWSDSASLARFTGEQVPVEPFRWPQCFDAIHEGIWANRDRKFLVMINGNKLPRLYWQELYTKRLEAVEFFNRHGEIDLYGRNWDDVPNRVGKTWTPWTLRRLHDRLRRLRQRLWPDPLYVAARQANRGPAESKSRTLGSYTFAICFENMILKGWITEKIFDCLYAGTVPVYWGDPEIQGAIPPECYIDMRLFKGFAELREFLHALGPDEIQAYRDAARHFLESPAYDPFRKETFRDIFRRLMAEDLGVEV